MTDCISGLISMIDENRSSKLAAQCTVTVHQNGNSAALLKGGTWGRVVSPRDTADPIVSPAPPSSL